VQPRQVDELVVHLHLRVQPALLGHVAEPAPGLEVHRRAPPADLPGVGGEHAERDAHGGGLAGPVGADEPEQLPGADVEGHLGQRDNLAVALGDMVDLEQSGHRMIPP